MTKNSRKLQIIVKFLKLQNIVKNDKKLQKCKKCQKRAKNGQKMATFKNKCHCFFGSKLPQQIDTVG